MTPPSPSLPHQWLDAAVELMGRSGRGGTVRVQGRSMLPTLEEGWLLAVEFAPDQLRRGDMLVFRRDDFLVVHRLLGPQRRGSTERPSLRMRGDGLPYLDPPVAMTSVIGRVLAVNDGHAWRNVRSREARLYAGLIALHDRFWALVTYFARKASAAVAQLGPRIPFERLSMAFDRALLRLVHGLAFRGLHRRIPPPLEAGPE